MPPGSAQEQRRVADPWEDILENNIKTAAHKSDDGFERVASADVLRIVLGIEYAQQTSAHGQRLALAMKWVGWERTNSGLVTIKGQSVRGYVRQSPPPTEAEIKAKVEKAKAEQGEGQGQGQGREDLGQGQGQGRSRLGAGASPYETHEPRG